MVKELWKPVVGFEGIYEVSNLGNVRSLDRVITYCNGIKHKHKGKLLTPKKNIKSGYLEVSLYKGKKGRSFRVNRLVALAFVPNPNNYPMVNHKDENILNNFANNLEWCTAKYNANYGNRARKFSISAGTKVAMYTLNGDRLLGTFNSICECSKYIGYHTSSICYALEHTGKCKKYFFKKI